MELENDLNISIERTELGAGARTIARATICGSFKGSGLGEVLQVLEKEVFADLVELVLDFAGVNTILSDGLALLIDVADRLLATEFKLHLIVAEESMVERVFEEIDIKKVASVYHSWEDLVEQQERPEDK